jgi:hypothetical protein
VLRKQRIHTGHCWSRTQITWNIIEGSCGLRVMISVSLGVALVLDPLIVLSKTTGG